MAVEVFIFSLDSVGKLFGGGFNFSNNIIVWIVEGVAENLEPFSRRECSAFCRGYLKRLMTQFLLSKRLS